MRIQYWECEGFRHIQSKYANTRKKKNKALKSTQSDEESNDSHEEDNLVSYQVEFSGILDLGNHLFIQECSGAVAIDTTCLSMKSNTVAIDSKSATSSLCDSDSDCGDESEKDDEFLQEACEKMYTQQLKVCATN